MVCSAFWIPSVLYIGDNYIMSACPDLWWITESDIIRCRYSNMASKRGRLVGNAQSAGVHSITTQVQYRQTETQVFSPAFKQVLTGCSHHQLSLVF